MTASAPRLRDRDAVEAQIAALALEADAREFYRGSPDGLRWLIDGGPAPLSAAVAEILLSSRVLVKEMAVAEDCIYGRRSRRRDYARGLEHALMWAQRATPEPPLPARNPRTARAGGRP